MKKLLCRILAFSSLFPAFLCFSAVSRADLTRSSYQMIGSATYLMDVDVLQPFAGPIELHRSKETVADHQVYFNVLRHQIICVAVQQVCVGYDAHGHCTGYEERCVQWEDRAFPVQKVLELNFTALPPLGKDQEEVYQLIINRTPPAGGDGEDWVTTNFGAESTVAPVKILRWSDYRYDISPRQ